MRYEHLCGDEKLCWGTSVLSQGHFYGPLLMSRVRDGQGQRVKLMPSPLDFAHGEPEDRGSNLASGKRSKYINNKGCRKYTGNYDE